MAYSIRIDLRRKEKLNKGLFLHNMLTAVKHENEADKQQQEDLRHTPH